MDSTPPMLPKLDELAGKEKISSNLKERHWQEELLGALLHPQVPQETESRPQPVNFKENDVIDSSSKIGPLKTDDFMRLLKISCIVTLLTSFLLWFFKPSFVMVRTQRYIDKNKALTEGSSTEVKGYDFSWHEDELSFTLVTMYSLLAGFFTFAFLFSISPLD